jgi:ParB-like chromosome segregation protein Spo0J
MDVIGRELDLHRLELRYAATRVADPGAARQLTTSLEQCGQLVPCVVVNDPGGSGLVLIDGYRRVEALHRLGRDTVRVECWACDLATALINLMVRRQDRGFALIEQALLLRELVIREGLSQRELATRTGRDVSWVNRRLQLLVGLADSVLAAVRAGELSSWAASRIVVPLARANSDHAERLLQVLGQERLSTRDLKTWFVHYQSGSHLARERMVDNPRLLLRALEERQTERRSAALRDGPEGVVTSEIRQIEAAIARLRRRLPTLRPVPEELISAMPRVTAALAALDNTITWSITHDNSRDLFERACAEGAGPYAARDQPYAASGAQYGAPDTAFAAGRGAQPGACRGAG